MATIKNIIAREILDSRSYPTVEVELILSNGIKSLASVPFAKYVTGTYFFWRPSIFIIFSIFSELLVFLSIVTNLFFKYKCSFEIIPWKTFS